MKKYPSFAAALFFLVFAVGCGASNETQEIGKNVDPSANLEDVKSFSWTSDINNIPNDKVFISPNGVYVFNVESVRNTIKNAIEYELDARGYKMNTGDPDMLVSFFILEQADSLRTTNGFVTVGGEQVLTEDNVSYTAVEPGTLIVNLMNKETSTMVWQGFASGILKPEDLNDEAKVRQAVSSIFSQFTHNNR